MSRTVKTFIKLFGPLALAICLSTWWFVHTRNTNNQENISQQQKSMVTLESELITRHAAAHVSDARFLARLAGRRLGTKLDNSALKTLEDDFADFGRSRHEYYQLRFLDNTGMERIRLDRTPAGLKAQPRAALQDKAKRYYFTRSIDGARDQVYISRFDLNMEHGRIEIPYKPSLRYVCPVIDRSGHTRGVVVLNYNGTPLLERLKSQDASGNGRTMLTTGQGYWILGVDPADEWGHILKGNDASMAKRFPEAWDIISRDEKGQFLTDQGLFTFDTVAVIPGARLSDARPTPAESARRWKILSWVPQAQLTVPWMNLFITLVVLFLVMLAVGCWNLACYRTRQAEVEANIRESEERTLAISQSSQDAIAMIDDQDRVTYWNPSAERILGYAAPEILGKRLHETLTPADLRAQAAKAFATFAITGKGNSVGRVLEFKALHKNGSLVPVELAVSSFQLKGRWYAVGSMRDITRRKRDEANLIRSDETNRALINAPTESALLIEPDGTIVASNKIAAQRLNVDPEAIIGLSIFDLLPPEVAELRRSIFAKAMAAGEPTQFEDSRAGMRLATTIYPSKNPDGTIDRIAIFSRDVTEQHQAKKALMLSEQRFRDVSEAVGEFIWETDAAGCFQFITEDVESVLGYTAAEMIGHPPQHFIIKESSEGFREWRNAAVTGLEAFSNIELKFLTKDGQVVWLQASGVPYFDEEGAYGGYRGAAMNITDRKASEDAIKASERKLRALAESAYDAIIMIDTKGLVSFWNHAASDLFGYTETEAMGKEVHTLIAPPEIREGADQGIHEFARTGDGPAVGAVEETVGLRKDGSRVPVERSVSGFQLGNEWFAVATVRDITERKKTELELTRLATTDSLTGLNNRRRFMESAEAEFIRSRRYDRPMSMFIMDIDHFKKVNDTYGHDVGDVVLRALSQTTLSALRNADTLGRIGGEEFAAILSETDENAAMEVAERVRAAVEQSRIPTNAGELQITISLGVACLHPDTKDLQELLKNADIALYKAKQSGRNRTVRG